MGGGGGCGVSANEYSCAHGAQINFGDQTPSLPYDIHHEENTKEENNGYVVFKRNISGGIGVVVKGGGGLPLSCLTAFYNIQQTERKVYPPLIFASCIPWVN